jgi:hypothetical protein
VEVRRACGWWGLHEGCHDGHAVGLNRWTAVVGAGDLCSGCGLGVAVCCGAMLDVELEVGEVCSSDTNG